MLNLPPSPSAQMFAPRIGVPPAVVKLPVTVP